MADVMQELFDKIKTLTEEQKYKVAGYCGGYVRKSIDYNLPYHVNIGKLLVAITEFSNSYVAPEYNDNDSAPVFAQMDGKDHLVLSYPSDAPSVKDALEREVLSNYGVTEMK